MDPLGTTLQAVRRQLAAVIAAATKHDSGLFDERRQKLDMRMKKQRCSICLDDEKQASEMLPMHANLTPWLNRKSSKEREHYVVCLECFQRYGADGALRKCPTCRQDVDHAHITKHRRNYGLMAPTPAIPERNTPGDDGDNDVGFLLQFSPIGSGGWTCRTRNIQCHIRSSNTLGLYDMGDNLLLLDVFTNAMHMHSLDNKSFSLYINISRPDRSYIGAWWRRPYEVNVRIYDHDHAMAMLDTPRPRYDPPMTF
jgi:hypothetical protein